MSKRDERSAAEIFFVCFLLLVYFTRVLHLLS